MTTVLPSMDFETFSEAGYYLNAEGKIKGAAPSGKGGLPVVGTPNYACHPSTDIICLYYDLKDGRGRRGWIPGTPYPVDLLAHIAAAGPIEAHNVSFEWWIWNAVGVRRYGWPALTIEQTYCTMAKARRHSLPGGLAPLAKVLGTPGKDKEGGRLITKLTRPHTPTKKRAGIRWDTSNAWPDFLAMYKYCDGDVYAEDCVSARMPDLTPAEREVWQADQRINARGVQVDTVTLDAALSILAQAEAKYNAELTAITGGAVTAATQTAKLQTWVNAAGIPVKNMQKETIAAIVESTHVSGPPLPPAALRALQIRQLLGSANIKKLHTLKLQTSSDGRLRNQYMYCGADRTGRWSAGGVQLQNMTGKGPKAYKCTECDGISGEPGWNMGECRRCGQWAGAMEPVEWGPEAMEWAIRDIQTGHLATIEQYWGDDPLLVLCGCLRGLFIAKAGHELMCVDFTAIEAVIAACISRCLWRIEIFRTHGKIYEQSAANATGIPFTEILQHKIDNGTHHPHRNKIGKVRELAGGYGGWIGSWVSFGADEFMNEDEIKADVLKWRAESPEIVKAWGGQFRHVGPGNWDYRPELFGLEGAAISAILSPGQTFACADVSYTVANDIMYCLLPSGRLLHYHKPRLTSVQDRIGRGAAYQITFEGWNSNPVKGPIGWVRMETYGGRLFENVCQAIGADFQAAAMVRLEANGYPVVMHTHDEATAEIPAGSGSTERMAELMTVLPEWASWWPIKADGWRGQRYRKD